MGAERRRERANEKAKMKNVFQINCTILGLSLHHQNISGSSTLMHIRLETEKFNMHFLCKNNQFLQQAAVLSGVASSSGSWTPSCSASPGRSHTPALELPT